MRFKGNLVPNGVRLKKQLTAISYFLTENNDFSTQKESKHRAARHFSQNVLLGKNGSEPADGEM